METSVAVELHKGAVRDPSSEGIYPTQLGESLSEQYIYFTKNEKLATIPLHAKALELPCGGGVTFIECKA